MVHIDPHCVDHDGALDDTKGFSCQQLLFPFWAHALDATLSVKNSAVGCGSLPFGVARTAAVVVI